MRAVSPPLSRLMSIFAALVLLVGCSSTKPANQSTPTIASFSALPASITRGESTTLHWSASGYHQLLIEPGSLDVSGSSSLNVSPVSSTIFTLIATNSSGAVQATTTVVVDGLPAPEPENPSIPKPEPDPSRPEPEASIRFNFEDAVGLQLGQPDSIHLLAGSNPSGVVKLTADGQLLDPLVAGEVTVQHFFIRNGRIYLLLDRGWEATDGCVLAEVDQDGFVYCLDSELSYVDVSTIQFDAHGGIFYRGYTTASKDVIRRYADGSTRDFYRAPDATYIEDFRVTREGIVIARGATYGTTGSIDWTRTIDHSNRVETLHGVYGFYDYLPDGSLLVDGQHGLTRLLFQDGITLDPKIYVCHYWWNCEYSEDPGSRFVLPEDFGDWPDLRSAMHSGLLLRSADEVMVLSSDGLHRIFPEPARIPLPLTRITNGDISLGLAVVAGYDAGANPMAYTVNLFTGEQYSILDNRRIEVLRLQVQLDRQRVLLYGLDLDHNQPVLAEYDLALRHLETAAVDQELAAGFTMLNWNINHVPPPTRMWTPDPDFTYEIGSGWDAGFVNFYADAAADFAFIDQFEWDLGDGTVGIGPNPRHLFEEPGTYDVRLTVTNDVGVTADTSHTITIDKSLSVSSATAGSGHAYVVADTGEVFLIQSPWTSHGLAPSGTSGPYLIEELPKSIIKVAAPFDYNYALALSNDGSVYAWGYHPANSQGGYDRPVLVPGLPSTITDIFAGPIWSAAVSADGRLYVWGEGQQIYDLTGEYSLLTPFEVTYFDEPIVAVTGDYSYMMALTSNGLVYAWGDNPQGTLGTGSTEYVSDPVLVNVSNVLSLYSLGHRSYALLGDGTVQAWGTSSTYPLGIEGANNYPEPTTLPDLEAVTDLFLGFSSVFALTESGELYGWGYNYSAQVADVESHPVVKPTHIASGTSFEFISPTHDYTLGIAAGRLYGWGSLGYDFLGAEVDYRQHNLLR